MLEAVFSLGGEHVISGQDDCGFCSFSALEGLLCLHSEQKRSRCEDFEVKFTCAGQFCSGATQSDSKFVLLACAWSFLSAPQCSVFTECRTRWFDHDDPSGHGDLEVLADLLSVYPGEICRRPTAIEVQTVSGEPASVTSQTFLK